MSHELRPVGEIAEAVTGRRPSPAAQWRWLHQGVCGGAVKLSAQRHAGRWLCTREAFEDFIAKQTSAALATPGDAPVESGRTERMERELAGAGLV
jgi:hypothetical protein